MSVQFKTIGNARMSRTQIVVLNILASFLWSISVFFLFFTVSCTGLAWEISLYFATVPLVSPRNDVWETTAEIPYWWRVTTQIWVVLLIGRAAKEICFNQSEALSRSRLWHVMSKEFLKAFLRRHFAVKLVVGSRSAGCFLRHVSWTIAPEIERETNCAFTSFSWSTLS